MRALVLKLKIETPAEKDDRGYDRWQTLAELDVALTPEVAWELYAQAVQAVRTPVIEGALS